MSTDLCHHDDNEIFLFDFVFWNRRFIAKNFTWQQKKTYIDSIKCIENREWIINIIY